MKSGGPAFLILFATLMGDHLSQGGLIIAATHTPLGIPARSLRIGDGP